MVRLGPEKAAAATSILAVLWFSGLLGTRPMP
jgi:hypothetical protein